MKKIILVSSCLLLSLILWMGNGTAKPVDTLTAKTVATHFLTGRNVELPRSAQQARIAYIGHSFDENSQRSVPCYYIVNLNQGFVILSADNRIEPILGYSTEGNFNAEDIPDNMLSFLDGYSAQIKAYLHDTSSTPNEATAKWTSLIRDDYTPNSTKGTVVGPLLTTIWNQNSPYNALCPTDANAATNPYLNGHVYAGCVATAMAQVIRYWQYPLQGSGGTKSFVYNSQPYYVDFNIAHYDYSKMPDFITTASPSNQITEIAKLTYHCGVSAATTYSIGGSSASLYYACNALNTYFSYNNTSSTMTPEYKNRSMFSDNDWIDMIKAELNAWRPVLYRGEGSSGGHAFVCDGYDDQNYFHFNWGWGGAYNGYFLLSSLTTGNGSFNSSQGVTIHIQGNTPMIKVSTPSLSFLCAANTVSEAKSLPLHGVALSSNIVITAPANFEISADGTTYYSSLNLSNTTSGIFVRYAPSASGQTTDRGTLTLTSGTTTQTVALIGHTYAFDCNPPQNVQHSSDLNGNIQLSWNTPTQDIHSHRFSIDSTDDGGIIGLGANRYILAQRACDSDLVAYHQKIITQISFYISPWLANSSERKIVIYQGGSFTNNALVEGTLIREQAIDAFSYGWNTVTLSEPVTIDAYQELWYGVHFYTTSSYPIVIGSEPGIAGKGDLVKTDGSWTLLSSYDPEFGINHNIPLKITIQDRPSSITNYTIERNNSIVGTSTNTQYNDHVTSSGEYTYNVTANWDNGCSATSGDITMNIVTNCTTTTGDTSANVCGSFDWYEHTGIQTSGDYTHTFLGGNAVGCDSTVTLHLTVNQPSTGDTTAFACNSFDWYEHHNITSSTNSLTHTFMNASGCDSVVTLHLTVGHSSTGDTTAFACDRFDWYEHHNITSSTSSLKHTFTNASGCDSVVTLHLTVGHSNTGDTTAFACDRFDWYEHTNITTSTNSLTHTFTNASGCDSVVTLHLTVGHSNTGDTTAFACDRFDWYEYTNITSSTSSLTHTFTNASGCDSVVTLHLTVGHSNTGDTTAFACNSFDWYEHTNITSSTNSLKHTFTNASGCDSVVTLHLTVGHSNTGDTTAFACNSFDWYEHHNITSSTNSLTHTFTNASGCDSVVTLHLTVGHSNTGDTTAFACNRFDWYEHTNITSSTNSLTHTFTNASGCDSTVTLHLTINQPSTGDTSATVCGSFDWYEHKNIKTSGDYTHTFVGGNTNGCDSLVTLHLVINNAVNTDTTAEAVETFVWHRAGAADTIITTSGTYTHTHPDANGCTQTDTLHLTVYHATGTQIDTAACESFVWHRPIAGDTTITDSGTYVDNLTDVHGADSVITLVLNIKHGNFIPFSVAECDSYFWHDTTYTESGNYLFEYINNVGCPSVDTLHLVINHAVNTDTVAEAVEAFVWHRAGAADTTITTSGTYTHAHPDANGCTQTDTLHLTVYHATGTQIDTAACESFVWQRPLAGDTTLLVSGIYYDTLSDVHGADSVITLVLNIKHGNFIPFSVAECDSYSWHDTTYTESGTYIFEYVNNVGCPSTDTLHLVINHAVNTDTTAEAVEAFVWHRAGAADTTITTSGTYTHTHPDANGCTQTDTLHLTVYHATGTQIDTAACESFVWQRPLAGDTTLLVSGIYYDTLTDVHGADSVITLVLNIKHGDFIPFSVAECDSYSWHDTTYTENGTYVFEYLNNMGCPSADTLHLTINHAVNTDTTAEAVESFVWHRAGAADTTITTSGTYTHTHPDANGCVQTDTLHLTVYHACGTQIDTAACESFVWHRPLAGDTIITNSGTYIDNLTDVHGADSVVTLVLTIYSAEHTDLHEYICQNELPYHYINGQIDTTFDVGTPSLLTVTYTLSTVNGCDSTVSLSITLFEVVNTDTVAEAVEAFVWHRAGAADTTITTSGTYTYAHPDDNGCTQTDTLHLTVYHATNTQIDSSACEVFLWHRPLAGDTIITNSGTYIDNLTDVHGADSVVTLVLTIYSTEHTDLHEYICQNELPYHYINGQIDTTFEVGTPSLLTVTYTLSTANGCDSTVTLNITLLEVVNTVAEAEAVEAFVWHRAGAADTTITSSGTYTHTHPNANGCTQTDTLHLTVYHATNTQIDTSACEEFLWHRPLAGDTIITNSGTYIDNLTDVHGADSVVTLVLSIYSTEHTDLNEYICQNELPYHYINGQIDTTFEVGTPSLLTVTYTLSTVNGCDSTVTLNLTVNPTYSVDTAVTITTNDLPYHFVSGQIDTTFEVGTPSQLSVPYTLSTVDGCDSTVTLHLTINVGIENHTAELLRAFPNPTTGHLTVIGSENFTQLQLFDTYGRRVGIYPVEGTQTEIDLHGLASGVYFLKAMREKQTAGTLKIIKNNE